MKLVIYDSEEHKHACQRGESKPTVHQGGTHTDNQFFVETWCDDGSRVIIYLTRKDIEDIAYQSVM